MYGGEFLGQREAKASRSVDGLLEWRLLVSTTNTVSKDLSPRTPRPNTGMTRL